VVGRDEIFDNSVAVEVARKKQARKALKDARLASFTRTLQRAQRE
jgi:hypothetical protein